VVFAKVVALPERIQMVRKPFAMHQVAGRKLWAPQTMVLEVAAANISRERTPFAKLVVTLTRAKPVAIHVAMALEISTAVAHQAVATGTVVMRVAMSFELAQEIIGD